MFKKLFLFALAITALTACESPLTDSQSPEEPTKLFTFHVKGDFAISQEEMSRAATRLENGNTSGLTDLWVLDYASDGTLIQQVHQASGDADFGSPQLSLTYGQHNVIFVASKGTTPALSAVNGSASGSLSWAKVLDTFTLAYPVTVSASSNGNRAPALERAISCVTVQNTDAVPSTARRMEVTLSKRYGTLSLPSLVGGGDNAYTNTFTLYAADAGQTNLQFATYTLCPSADDVFTTDVTVRVYGDSDVLLSEFTIPNVELKQNRKTILKGRCFERSGSPFAVSVNGAWQGDNILNI